MRTITNFCLCNLAASDSMLLTNTLDTSYIWTGELNRNLGRGIFSNCNGIPACCNLWVFLFSLPPHFHLFYEWVVCLFVCFSYFRKYRTKYSYCHYYHCYYSYTSFWKMFQFMDRAHSISLFFDNVINISFSNVW